MKTQSKTSYVLKQPATTPAKEVVKRAKADGIKLSVAQVYNIRSTAKRRGAVWGRGFEKLAKTEAAGPVPGGLIDFEDNAPERAFRVTALNIGLIRARALLDEMGGQS